MELDAPALYANQGIPITARTLAQQAPIVANILDHHTRNVRFRRNYQQNFLDVLYLTDLTALPFPDEPPVVYPSAEYMG